MRRWVRRRKGQSTVSITVDAAGFVMMPDGDVSRWADVARVWTYKVDLIATDLICLRFEFRPEADAVVVHEEMPGFAELMASMSEHLPGLDPAWYDRVMRPAFAANTTAIWPPR